LFAANATPQPSAVHGCSAPLTFSYRWSSKKAPSLIVNTLVEMLWNNLGI
jgi:hypothetical protein